MRRKNYDKYLTLYPVVIQTRLNEVETNVKVETDLYYLFIIKYLRQVLLRLYTYTLKGKIYNLFKF